MSSIREKHNCFLMPAGDGLGEGGWEGKAVKGEQNIDVWSKRTRRNNRFGLYKYL